MRIYLKNCRPEIIELSGRLQKVTLQEFQAIPKMRADEEYLLLKNGADDLILYAAEHLVKSVEAGEDSYRFNSKLVSVMFPKLVQDLKDLNQKISLMEHFLSEKIGANFCFKGMELNEIEKIFKKLSDAETHTQELPNSSH